MKKVFLFFAISSMSICSSLMASSDPQLSRVPQGSTFSPIKDIVLEANTTITPLSQTPKCRLFHDSATTTRRLGAGLVLSVADAGSDYYVVRADEAKTIYVLNDVTFVRLTTSGGFKASVGCENRRWPLEHDLRGYSYTTGPVPGNLDHLQCVIRDAPNTPEMPRCLVPSDPELFFLHDITPFFNIVLKDATPIE